MGDVYCWFGNIIVDGGRFDVWELDPEDMVT